MYTSNRFCYYLKFNIDGMYASLAYNIVLCAAFVHLSSHIPDWCLFSLFCFSCLQYTTMLCIMFIVARCTNFLWVISENDDSMAGRLHSELASGQAWDERGRFTRLLVGQQMMFSIVVFPATLSMSVCSSARFSLPIFRVSPRYLHGRALTFASNLPMIPLVSASSQRIGKTSDLQSLCVGLLPIQRILAGCLGFS
jgi:hypothetical protein